MGDYVPQGKRRGWRDMLENIVFGTANFFDTLVNDPMRDMSGELKLMLWHARFGRDEYNFSTFEEFEKRFRRKHPKYYAWLQNMPPEKFWIENDRGYSVMQFLIDKDEFVPYWLLDNIPEEKLRKLLPNLKNREMTNGSMLHEYVGHYGLPRNLMTPEILTFRGRNARLYIGTLLAESNPDKAQWNPLLPAECFSAGVARIPGAPNGDQISRGLLHRLALYAEVYNPMTKERQRSIVNYFCTLPDGVAELLADTLECLKEENVGEMKSGAQNRQAEYGRVKDLLNTALGIRADLKRRAEDAEIVEEVLAEPLDAHHADLYCSQKDEACEISRDTMIPKNAMISMFPSGGSHREKESVPVGRESV